MFRYLSLLVPVVLVSCSNPTVCVPEVVTAITIEVRNADTREPLAEGTEITGEVDDMMYSFVEDLQQPSLYRHLMSDIPGIYSVTVVKPGFKPWVQENVAVEGGRCGVSETTFLEANLRPTDS